MELRVDVRCPKCNKKVAEKERGVKTRGIYFWCNRCREEFAEELKEGRSRN